MGNGMKTIRDIGKMQEIAESLRLKGKRIGFVPTMGFLHDGHLSLIRRAKEESDVVILSIYVNPTQFSPNEDLDKYPRDLKRDEALAKEAGVDYLFTPSDAMMYPQNYLTYIHVDEITGKLCGKSRPHHFQGVTTICAKLFHIVKPHVAVFGQKDAQQALIIRKMVRDLNFDLEIITAPIVREPDGLAMSSRNTYLSPEERKQALSLKKSLDLASQMIEQGERDAALIQTKMREIINQSPLAKIDYVEIVSQEDLESLPTLQGNVLIALAVYFGKTRLIDNVMLRLGG